MEQLKDLGVSYAMQRIQQKEKGEEEVPEEGDPVATPGQGALKGHEQWEEGPAAHHLEVSPTSVTPARFQMARPLGAKPVGDPQCELPQGDPGCPLW